jgi:N-acyl-D-aspartate/D-glutamate deacylase
MQQLKNISILFISILALSSCSRKFTKVDILIKNGSILDGNGIPSYFADIGISADTIAFIGDRKKGRIKGKQKIQARGYILTPGFIDPHTHALDDLSSMGKKANLNYLYQGVTTVLTGSDGGGIIEVDKRFKKWEAQGIGTNAAMMAGHRSIRRKVMGMRDALPTEEEMNNMKSLVTKAMEEGALGLSSGLYYTPTSFATTEEVIELAKIAASYGGIYDVHIRDESTYNIGLLAAVEETITIAREANIHANISHIKALGADVWGKSQDVIDLVETAQQEGLSISADQYPYEASGTHLDNALLPKWVFANDPNYREKLDHDSIKTRVFEGVKENLRIRGGSDRILLIAPVDLSLKGKTLTEVAKEWNMPPVETAIKIMKGGSSAIASFNMQEDDIHNFMKQDWVMTCSDGTNAHPRKYGSFPKKIREYVLDKKVLNMEEMVRKSTSLTAEIFNIPKRGKIQKGYYADLLIFKPEEVKDNATFENPDRYATGMKYVIVNGQIVIEGGRYNGKLAGKVIKHKPKP